MNNIELLKAIHTLIEDNLKEDIFEVEFGQLKKSFHNEEERIALDVVYAPYELDAHNEWMSEETIKKACDNFNHAWEAGKLKMNLFHMKDTDQIKLLKSYILDEDTQFGDQLIHKGTWLAEYQFLNDDLWKLKKAGVIGGLSLCGGCSRIRVEPKTDSEVE